MILFTILIAILNPMLNSLTVALAIVVVAILTPIPVISEEQRNVVTVTKRPVKVPFLSMWDFEQPKIGCALPKKIEGRSRYRWNDLGPLTHFTDKQLDELARLPYHQHSYSRKTLKQARSPLAVMWSEHRPLYVRWLHLQEKEAKKEAKLVAREVKQGHRDIKKSTSTTKGSRTWIKRVRIQMVEVMSSR